MPEPIMDPATSIVESSKPSPLMNFSSVAGGEVVIGNVSTRVARIYEELIITQANRAMLKRSVFQTN